MNLFQQGEFQLSSGIKSPFKIDCDALTDEDIECLARLISSRFFFGDVIGVPTGGDRLKKALEEYCIDTDRHTLICDDVLTTGDSMEQAKKKVLPRKKVIGVVIFARGKCPDWVTPIFQLWNKESL